jgi:hypothetical protein
MTYLVRGTCYAPGCDGRAGGRYVNGWLCAEHRPDAPEPDPGRTLAALRTFVDGGRQARKGGSDIVKERPGGYVSRQRAERIGQGTAPRQERRPR